MSFEFYYKAFDSYFCPCPSLTTPSAAFYSYFFCFSASFLFAYICSESFLCYSFSMIAAGISINLETKSPCGMAYAQQRSPHKLTGC